MKMVGNRLLSAAILGLLVAVATSHAQGKKVINASVETVLTGLDNPCGVAVQPGTGHVFVADSAAGRVVRLDPDNPGQSQDVIIGFPQDVYGKGPMYNIGPLGLAFIDKQTLVVGGGGLKDGSELLRIYELTSGGGPISANQMKYKLGPLAPGEQTKEGEGNFYGLAVSPTAIYVTCNGDDTKGWVSKADISAGRPGNFQPFIATKVATNVDAPVGITLNEHRGYIVIGQMGEINKPRDSLLTFYSPKDGAMTMNLETGLFDIAGLAYSRPDNTGKLYAVDFAWMDTTEGGLFRLDSVGSAKVEAVKVLPLDKPTALAFAPDGTLYVTVFGTAEDGSGKKPGKLMKITGDL